MAFAAFARITSRGSQRKRMTVLTAPESTTSESVHRSDELDAAAAQTHGDAPSPADSARSPGEPEEVLAQVSRQLDMSHKDLQEQVSLLRAELAVSRTARLRELAEKERLFGRLSSLLAVLPGGIVLLDSGGVVRDANPTALELLGEPLFGESWEAIKLRNPELSGDRRTGRYLSVKSRRLDSQNEELVLITDTTETHDLEQQLGRQHRLAAMGEMAARLAHQIRTPLAATTLYLSQLGRQDLANDQRSSITERLGERLAHMEGLIEAMLSFVRGRTPERKPLQIRAVLDAVEANVRPALREGVSLTITPVDQTLEVLGAQEELVGAIGNLVRNASELAQESVHIDVWAGATSPTSMQIRVRDSGPGISEEVLPRLFDPFFTTRAKGTGLGLAVVAMTAAQHEGQIRAQNSLHGGAEFLLDLPLIESRSAPVEVD